MDDNFTIDRFTTCYRESVRHEYEEISISSPVAPFATIQNPRSVYDDFYNGDHYKLLPRMGAWRSRPYKNITRTVVDSNTTFLTDSRPRITALPQEPGDDVMAELVNAGMDYWWDRKDMDVKEHGAIKLSRKYGLGWMGLFHEPDSVKSAGGAEVPYVLHPDCLHVDPDATMENYDPTWLIYEAQVQYGDLLADKRFTVDEATFDVNWHPADAGY